MDSSFSLANVVFASINFFTLMGTIFFLFSYRKSRSEQENKTKASSFSLSSSQPYLPHNWKYNVFPSFHGADVRKTFLSHIIKEFRRKGIDLFVDNNMERSKSIGPELIEAIRGSRIAIVLLSKNYASSTWCLNELVEIIKCREELDQIVMVVFYEVDPTDVKKQTGDFVKVFSKTCQGKTKDDIRRWKHALAEVAKIAGYHSRNWENEAEMIEEIATDVSNKLNNSTPSSDFDNLVGMESHMIKMAPFLRLDSDEVRIIGILGPSGIGKTTIARFLFKKHSGRFQLSVFMENIKKRYAVPVCSDDYSVKVFLQEQFMSQLTNAMGFKISHLGSVKDRLKERKVLVVLDDVDRLVQLEAMAKETGWFGPWSRIIITTQDQKLLKASSVNHVYRVDFPSSDEAFQMFCIYAFGHKSPKYGFTKLALEVTRLTGELPLGLRVMGSYFRGMSKNEWTNALPRAINRLDGEIESILMFSYDALRDEDKCLFLHIACFFKYDPADKVESCLANSFSDVTQGLHVLAEKSLISMDSGRIEMHNLLVHLGREIVRKQSVSEPRNRLFLDNAKDIGEVLSDDKAECGSVIGIDLRSFDLNEETITCTSERALERLANLQFLRFDGDCTNLYSPQCLNSISSKLRSLSWAHFLLSSLPSNFDPKFLVELDMQFSKLEKLWEGIQPLSNLKWINLSFSKSLKELPDLSTATNLKELNLRFCSSLVELPFSIGNAINLQKLDISYCSSLVEIPSSVGNVINLQKLEINHCSSLVEIPSSIGNAIDFRKLDLSHCSSLVQLPSFIESAMNLQKLDLTYCISLVELPSSIENAINLQHLSLSHCTSLMDLPFSIANAINLQDLDLSHCSSLMELPSSIGNAINLQELDLSHCTSLVELPFSIANAINLQHLNLSHCTSLVELPSFIGNAFSLQHLDLSYCSSLVELPYSIGYIISLQHLNLRYCSTLVELPSSIGNAVYLQELYLGYCSSLLELPSSMKKLCRLLKLELKKCSKLEVLLANINLESLEELNLSGCSLLKNYPETSTNIEDLTLSGNFIKGMPSSMRHWHHRRGISSLRRLVLRGMHKLVSLPQLPYSLLELDAEDCKSLERLDCSFCNPDIRLMFVSCFKLNQEARDVIIQTPTNEYAVLPGGEVPVCFTYLSSGSSLTVKLNQEHLGTSIKFKACIIFADDMDENKFGQGRQEYVYCSVTSKENALTVCGKALKPILPEHMYIFEVEAVEVTSTELVFDFKLSSWLINSLKIKECGMKLLGVPSC
ncbi:hypothetical protein N665_0054s0032 [Sinapis alba]|nr:hypothetical protein N665_0054s0032 [Sinapis alba]